MDRAVFDCMVYLQAVANENSPAFACFSLVDADRIQPCLSEAVLAEVLEVLNRPKLQMKFRRLTPERIAAFIQRVQTKAVMLDDVPRLFTYERDPDDEKYVDLALAAGARFIVSRDKDLLSLMSDGLSQSISTAHDCRSGGVSAHNTNNWRHAGGIKRGTSNLGLRIRFGLRVIARYFNWSRNREPTID